MPISTRPHESIFAVSKPTSKHRVHSWKGRVTGELSDLHDAPGESQAHGGGQVEPLSLFSFHGHIRFHCIAVRRGPRCPDRRPGVDCRADYDHRVVSRESCDRYEVHNYMVVCAVMSEERRQPQRALDQVVIAVLANRSIPSFVK